MHSSLKVPAVQPGCDLIFDWAIATPFILFLSSHSFVGFVLEIAAAWFAFSQVLSVVQMVAHLTVEYSAIQRSSWSVMPRFSGCRNDQNYRQNYHSCHHAGSWHEVLQYMLIWCVLYALGFHQTWLCMSQPYIATFWHWLFKGLDRSKVAELVRVVQMQPCRLKLPYSFVNKPCLFSIFLTATLWGLWGLKCSSWVFTISPSPAQSDLVMNTCHPILLLSSKCLWSVNNLSHCWILDWFYHPLHTDEQQQ